MSIPVVVTIGLYLFLVMALGVVAARKLDSLSDFFIANRSLGPWVTAISSTATSESGWVFIGACGLAYKSGVSAVWFIPGCLTGYMVNWFFVAPKLQKASAECNAITLGDLLDHWFDDKKHTLRIFAAIVIFFSMMGYVAAQLTAAGKAFDAVFGWSYLVGVLGGSAVVIFYTLLGGFRAVAWTDLVQGIMMVLGLIILPLVALDHVGGLSNLLTQLDAESLSLTRVDGGKSLPAAVGMIVGLLGIGLGYPGQPQVLVRYMAAKDANTIFRGRVIALTWGVLVYYGAVILGLCGRLLNSGIEDPEYIFPLLAIDLLPPVVAGAMVAAVLAAMMSTADSQLLVAASALVRDVFGQVLKSELVTRRAIWFSRGVVVVLGLLSTALALTEARVVFWFVLFAWSGLGASFGPLLLVTFFGRKPTRAAALTGMIVGFVVTIIWNQTGLSDRIVYELVPAFLLSWLSIIVVTRMTQDSTAN